MESISFYKNNISANGFTVIEAVYTQEEIEAILAEIAKADTDKNTFRKTDDLFAIRQFLKELPAVNNIIFNTKLTAIIDELFGDDYFAVKSIYFDKPEKSNWFVAWHQDLTISVNKKADLPGYGPWTVKQNQFAVQPPLNILQNNFTIRIHLDDTDEGNGALKVIPGSHLKGVYRPETIDWNSETEQTCNVKAGGIMIMKPLLLHASNRTTNNKPRKVIHIEFSKANLPDQIEWSERQLLH
ncbi:phytanoyl-CoA dioxygenase family protein [Mucilaginibacter sp. 14171R-50]|uniref:phytanoyl-CoA dioxygenase family protein n=1 Tax=Mucilaginibacter sp. 14171R-50 TaxID=2703789 RepID=UPI00138BFD9D|nr:phytanoyl-CoA dioxygenase family protein [Mucilaginibacter sp. 14171R-50]QHS56777.1 phytanoyl-CoA dioxygenase family protein [Mucilaginibacter sp. 14171R-50]